MEKNNQGFSLVELLAVIVITSFILVPLMTAFTNNVTIYDRLEKRRSTVGMIDVMVNSIDRLDFSAIYSQLDSSAERYYVLNANECTNTFTGTAATFCESFFGLTYNNQTLDSEDLEIYFFDWNISATEMTLLEAQGFHSTIYNELANVTTNDFAESTSVMRFAIIGHYGDGENEVVTIGGVMAIE